jgi:glycerate 2-kinase
VALHLLVAPDSFKGSLTSAEVARALAVGWRRARPADGIALAPLADGGEGTIEAILAADHDWAVLSVAARDPLGRPLDARFLRRGGEAVIELADASGISRLTPDERDARGASTFGTGLVLAAAIGLGVRRIVLGIGGSATTDGGSGLLAALGARFLDPAGRDLPPGGGPLADLARVDFSGFSPVLGEIQLVVASDVTNPLLGIDGAAAVYGPQKGASAADVAALDAALTIYADHLELVTGRNFRDEPGAGAAGGTGAGLLAIADRFASFEVRSGVETVMGLVDFSRRLAGAELVITGEGRIDGQTAFGKTALGVARRAREAGVVCIAVGGAALPDGIEALAALGVTVVPVSEGPGTVDAAMAAGTAPLERAGERIARLVSAGAQLAGPAGRASDQASRANG